MDAYSALYSLVYYLEHLQDRLAQEVAKPDAFSDLPFRFSEISKVLLDVASDDLENPDQLHSLLKDLQEARQAKSREGLKHLDHSELGVRGHDIIALDLL